jgi:hypothetical protein
MDMNYYLHREQVERTRADQAGSDPVRQAHRGLAELYREKIVQYRAENVEQPQIRA